MLEEKRTGDNTHSIEKDGATTIVVDKGADSAECRIVNLIEKAYDIFENKLDGVIKIAIADE